MATILCCEKTPHGRILLSTSSMPSLPPARRQAEESCEGMPQWLYQRCWGDRGQRPCFPNAGMLPCLRGTFRDLERSCCQEKGDAKVPLAAVVEEVRIMEKRMSFILEGMGVGHRKDR